MYVSIVILVYYQYSLLLIKLVFKIRRKDYLQLLFDAETSNVDIQTKFIDHSKAVFEKKLTTMVCFIKTKILNNI